jgi:hypothetical protein
LHVAFAAAEAGAEKDADEVAGEFGADDLRAQ